MITTQLHTQRLLQSLNLVLKQLLCHKINVTYNYLITCCVQGLKGFALWIVEQQACINDHNMIVFYSKLLDPVYKQNAEEDKKYFDTYQTSKCMNPQENFFDSIDPTTRVLYLNLMEPLHHVVDVTKRHSGTQCYTGPAVSQQAGLELLTSSELQINMALQPLHGQDPQYL